MIVFTCRGKKPPTSQPQPKVYCVPCLHAGRKVLRTRTCDIEGCSLPLCDECAHKHGLPFDVCPTRHLTVEGDGE